MPITLKRRLRRASRQILETMKALSRCVPVIILDEPTAALFDQVRVLKAAGVSFIYISHHLDEVFEIADKS